MKIIFQYLTIGLLMFVTGCANQVMVSDNKVGLTDPVDVLPNHFRIIGFSNNEKETDSSYMEFKKIGKGRYVGVASEAADFESIMATTFALDPPNYIIEFQLEKDQITPYHYAPIKISENEAEIGTISVYDANYKELATIFNLSDSEQLKTKNEHEGFVISGNSKSVVQLSKVAILIDAEPAFAFYNMNDNFQKLKLEAELANRRANKAEKELESAAKREKALRENAKSENTETVATESPVEKAPVKEAVTEKPSTGLWAFSDESTNSRTRRYIALMASQSTGAYRTMLRMSCTENGMGVEVIWGVPLMNLYPNESVPTATRVFAKFGDSAVWDMAWQPVSNSTVTREPRVQLDISSTIDSAIFSFLGMDSISKKNKAMFDWTPEQFFNRMAKHEYNADNPILKLSSKTAGNQNLTSVFDLTGFNEMAKQKFGGVCGR